MDVVKGQDVTIKSFSHKGFNSETDWDQTAMDFLPVTSTGKIWKINIISLLM
jgi:hypothetical protein